MLPAHLLAQLGDWMPSFRELMAPCGPPVLLHTDLHDQHVLGTIDHDRFQPTGVIDFSQMRMGPALYELGMIWRGLFPGDRRLLRAVVEEARLPGHDTAGFPRLALGWCLLHEGVAQLGLDEPWMDGVRTLDELAERSFGSAG